jgi:hypothetical protein
MLEPSIKQFLGQDEMVFTVIRLRRPSALNKRIFACLEVSPG